MKPQSYPDDILSVYQRSFREYWELPALTDYGSKEVMTYGDLARRIARIHLFYKQLGIRPEGVAELPLSKLLRIEYFELKYDFSVLIRIFNSWRLKSRQI